MSGQDDQPLLSILGGISSDIKRFGNWTFDTTDKGVDYVATSIRSALDSMPWASESMKPSPPPQVPVRLGYWDRLADWVFRHKAITAALMAFVGTGGAIVYYQQTPATKKRKAKRAPSGARKEVVVIAGPPESPVTMGIARDLEGRGFIVYIAVFTRKQQQLVAEEMEVREDIRSFLIDPLHPDDGPLAIERFHRLLSRDYEGFRGAALHRLEFSGFILVPDIDYQTGPLEVTTPSQWAEEFSTKVVQPVALTQGLLPIIRAFEARVLILTPTVIPSLSPPFHSMESSVVSALRGFATTIRSELQTVGIHVSEIRLGNFNWGTTGIQNQPRAVSSSQTLSWPSTARTLYAQNFNHQRRLGDGSGLLSLLFSGGKIESAAKGSSPRLLHHAVFDALSETRAKKVYRIGKGSIAYDLIGSWIPGGLVGWVLGMKKVPPEQVKKANTKIDDESTAIVSLQDMGESWVHE